MRTLIRIQSDVLMFVVFFRLLNALYSEHVPLLPFSNLSLLLLSGGQFLTFTGFVLPVFLPIEIILFLFNIKLKCWQRDSDHDSDHSEKHTARDFLSLLFNFLNLWRFFARLFLYFLGRLEFSNLKSNFVEPLCDVGGRLVFLFFNEFKILIFKSFD